MSTSKLVEHNGNSSKFVHHIVLLLQMQSLRFLAKGLSSTDSCIKEMFTTLGEFKINCRYAESKHSIFGFVTNFKGRSSPV